MVTRPRTPAAQDRPSPRRCKSPVRKRRSSGASRSCGRDAISVRPARGSLPGRHRSPRHRDVGARRRPRGPRPRAGLRTANQSLAAHSQRRIARALLTADPQLAPGRAPGSPPSRQQSAEAGGASATRRRKSLDVARTSFQTAQAQLAARLRQLYAEGDVDPLAVLLGAESLDEIVSALDGLNRLATPGQGDRRPARACQGRARKRRPRGSQPREARAQGPARRRARDARGPRRGPRRARRLPRQLAASSSLTTRRSRRSPSQASSRVGSIRRAERHAGGTAVAAGSSRLTARR